MHYCLGALSVILILPFPLYAGVESTHYNMTSIQAMLSPPGPYPDLKPENGDKIIGVLPFYREWYGEAMP